MAEPTVVCPNCKTEIKLTESLAAPLLEATRFDFEQTIASMQKQIEELKRRAEQGSQQLQGEVMELELENLLRTRFPRDTIEPVPKGVHGGDVLHHVLGPLGQPCGTILWESKRTKNHIVRDLGQQPREPFCRRRQNGWFRRRTVEQQGRSYVARCNPNASLAWGRGRNRLFSFGFRFSGYVLE